MPLHPQVQQLLDNMAQAEGPAASEMPIADARAAFRALSLLQQGEEVTRVDDRHVPVPDGDDIPIRVYTPHDAVGGEAGVLLWFHGGGWTLGDLDTADATCRALANGAGAVVITLLYAWRFPELRNARDFDAPAEPARNAA